MRNYREMPIQSHQPMPKNPRPTRGNRRRFYFPLCYLAVALGLLLLPLGVTSAPLAKSAETATIDPALAGRWQLLFANGEIPIEGYEFTFPTAGRILEIAPTGTFTETYSSETASEDIMLQEGEQSNTPPCKVKGDGKMVGRVTAQPYPVKNFKRPPTLRVYLDRDASNTPTITCDQQKQQLGTEATTPLGYGQAVDIATDPYVPYFYKFGPPGTKPPSSRQDDEAFDHLQIWSSGTNPRVRYYYRRLKF